MVEVSRGRREAIRRATGKDVPEVEEPVKEEPKKAGIGEFDIPALDSPYTIPWMDTVPTKVYRIETETTDTTAEWLYRPDQVTYSVDSRGNLVNKGNIIITKSNTSLAWEDYQEMADKIEPNAVMKFLGIRSY